MIPTIPAGAPVVARRPKLAHRLMLALAVAEFYAPVAFILRVQEVNGRSSDITPVIVGVRAVLDNLNPYAADPDQPLLYPFTALVLLAPAVWAAIPPAGLDALWGGVSAGLLTWAVTRERLWSPALVIVFSPAMFQAIQTSQWSPLMVALMLIGRGSGFVYACKPSTALWLFAYRPTRRAVIEGAALTAVSLIVWPGWPLAWLDGLSEARWSLSLFMMPGGLLLLLALLKWRRPEARMLATMACAPQTPLLYETLPLYLIPQTWVQAGVLWVGMSVARLGEAWSRQQHGTVGVETVATWIVWCVYLPALVMILRRPNRADFRD